MIGNLFVYGSLKDAVRIRSALPKAFVLRKNVRIFGYEMYEYERYPILLPKWGSSVWGEIHLLPDSDWEVLDAYEETHLGVYERIFDETYSFYLYIAGANAKIKTSALLPEGLWPSDEFG